MAKDTLIAAGPFVEDGHVKLRRWSQHDAGVAAEALRLDLWPEPELDYAGREGEAAVEWVNLQNERIDSGKGWALAIEAKPIGEAVGYVSLVKHQQGVINVGYWLLPQHRGQGLASRAVALVAEWALTEGGFKRVDAWVEPGNDASVAVLERNRFALEGLLRSYMPLPGRQADVYMFARVVGD